MVNRTWPSWYIHQCALAQNKKKFDLRVAGLIFNVCEGKIITEVVQTPHRQHMAGECPQDGFFVRSAGM
jgi:hypothetical protein